MHKVEIDDEVFRFVQSRAEPLVDSFNSALRRVLQPLIGKGWSVVENSSATEGKADDVPPGMPQALLQILEVVWLVRAGRTRRDATREVAIKLGVAPQTVIDKYTRQLGLTAPRFDRLLAGERCDELQKLLHGKFSENIDDIDRVFGKKAPKEHPLDIADRLFGTEHGAELPIPPRGTGLGRSPPDFAQFEQHR